MDIAYMPRVAVVVLVIFMGYPEIPQGIALIYPGNSAFFQ
jgi:hypothetical protein